ncbi:glycosyltransferase family 4 protein [Streptomyces sp. SAJ15]|uniref:glycosyltransferase family 4 protein n=1 Tax=Streptomyces sp. SAJ15 TaxID=2011095 RepID=UPI0011862F36|nr:glycosyltransferase family 4 protein [Streptomyces sp. SAJ15]TVL90554.1 glycosyl transferase family 1 [Streptomyces sp. SAJ15]
MRIPLRPTPTVLHISQPVDGGVARVVADLVRAQATAGLRPVVACPPGGTLAAQVTAAGVTTVPWAARREPGARLPREAAQIARIVRRTGPDLVHAHSAKAGLAARLAVRGRVPTLYQPHAWSFEAADGATAALALRWERFAARWAQRIVCVSEDERRRGEGAGVPGRWTVIRNGVDTGRFRPADEDARRRARAAVPALRDLPADTPLAVCVGRLCRQKGQDLLLRAWPRTAAEVPGARLALVGDGPELAALRRAAPADVLLPGPAADTAPWYAAADLVVLPSRWEGMALAPLEAMASGRPVLLTEVTGARESLPVGHASACLVPPDDPPALARALTVLLRRPALRARLGHEAQRHVHTAHDVRDTAAAVTRLYRELLEPARNPYTDRGELCRG